ncbi:arginine n-methyltransferase 2 [Ophiostoma piceae UAMH 11346]|uniref:Arginine N-methyltransferase 2 n=1 Tax=Ophiostoma piceae (strain UAMH 11346) TaxID=1262450 RepID=S3BX27_OPHP1|nr:arginine n-methyltransferase 2 [Ophiostoma piceae UAMH 11346]
MDDSIEARISSECPVETQAILRAAWRHDLPAIKPFLSGPGKASCSDPTTGETPLHAAIRSLGPVTESDEKDAKDEAETEAVKTVEHLLLYGAIWNDVDDNNETPGCVAWRLGRKGVYEVMLRAGMRAEMLFAILDGYEELGSEGEDDDNDDEMAEGETGDVDVNAEADAEAEAEADANDNVNEAETEDVTATTAKPASEDAPYLESKLTLVDGKLVDAAGNGVMMAWEKDIMRRSVDAMLGDGDAAKGKRVLNIGFGLGIIDSMIAATQPARHHVIEAHPEVLARIDAASASGAATSTGGSDDHAAEFGAAWEATSTVEPGAYKIQRGRWQDICPKLLAEGELYDAIYFDTFGEDYSELHRFFSDYIPGLLDDQGVFGFFNGLGADRRICYDVYTRVVEMHLSDAGLDVAWQDVDVQLAEDGLDTAGKGAWEGILRPYWTLETYRLPTCTFMG